MNSIKAWIICSVLILSASARAELLTLVAGSSEIKGVNISTAATANLEGRAIALTTVGAGVRTKVVIFKIDVYVAELFVDDLAVLDKSETGVLASLDKVGAVAIRMTFLRDVPANKMSTAFQDGFDANSISSKSTELTEFLAKVSQAGDAKAGGSLTLLITRNQDGTTTIAYENLKGGVATVQTLTGGSKTLSEILAIWLGKPADSGLADLKLELLK